MTSPPPETPPEPAGSEPAASAASESPASSESPAASDPSGSSESPALSDPSGSSARSKQPSLAPGAVLLVLAGVLIVIVLVKPDMPDWLRTTIAILAVVVVIGLLAYAFVVFRETTRGGSR